MEETRTEIGGVLIPVSETRLLLPNAVIAEVVPFVAPNPVATKAAWLLGNISWREQSLPLVSVATFAGFVDKENLANVKLAVLKGLGGHARVPYLAVLAQGFPRLTTIGPETVQVDTTAERRPGIAMSVRLTVDEGDAHIPDLDAIEAAVAIELG